MFVWLHTARSNLSMGSYCLYRASRPLRKGRSSVSPSTDFETMASHHAGVVYFTEYLSVLFQLTYLDELYGESNELLASIAPDMKVEMLLLICV